MTTYTFDFIKNVDYIVEIFFFRVKISQRSDLGIDHLEQMWLTWEYLKFYIDGYFAVW